MSVAATARKTRDRDNADGGSSLRELPPGAIPLIRCPRCWKRRQAAEKVGRRVGYCYACQGTTGYMALPGDIADALCRERGGEGLSNLARISADIAYGSLTTVDAEDDE